MDDPDIIEVGVIEQLSERQSEVMGIIQDARDSADKTMEDGLLMQLGYKDDVITALVLAKRELQADKEIEVMDLLWASAFLDHLDTLGYRVKRKK